ncbi:MAG TPA: secondary thiamine-phosphate synthase enzyme YjbQ [Spirochaetota bacterium]|nr:secondary thiamine-phosphate synthase enzyme YjbQ [Spirochaetota bacterium]HPN13538.1 secondary thiamine-phosphate synthase enzyme YjbQ [Spirochaetota bacterium]HQL83024.1 secondary thiamine-phosphate synthase enzyme YjbQ [Spirochaetota bacterium]
MISFFTVKTKQAEQLIDITGEVSSIISRSSISDGICIIYTAHTTAAITINENADPTVRTDIIKGLNHLDLESVSYRHQEGNSPAHIKSSLIGCSMTVIIHNGRLNMGTWQGIFLCEFDGPRTRNVLVKIL